MRNVHLETDKESVNRGTSYQSRRMCAGGRYELMEIGNEGREAQKGNTSGPAAECASNTTSRGVGSREGTTDAQRHLAQKSAGRKGKHPEVHEKNISMKKTEQLGGSRREEVFLGVRWRRS